MEENFLLSHPQILTPLPSFFLPLLELSLEDEP